MTTAISPSEGPRLRVHRYEQEGADERGELWLADSVRELFSRHGLTTISAWLEFEAGEVVRVHGPRRTARFELADAAGQTAAFYLKRHAPLPAGAYLKALSRMNWPIAGARPEYEAICRFEALGLPTVNAVAFGEHAGWSILVTRALDEHMSVADWLGQSELLKAHAPERGEAGPAIPAARLFEPLRGTLQAKVREQLARYTRRMHAAGLFHQDLYLNHVLIRRDAVRDRSTADASQSVLDLRLIDLGRVRHARVGTFRWRWKDLAQLGYSARALPPHERHEFLRSYLGRAPDLRDLPMLVWMTIKAWWIARHTRRRKL